MIWFKNQHVGINSLSKYMKLMCDGADICKKTNHSARKTMIMKLMQNDIHPNNVAQLSGHKNIIITRNFRCTTIENVKYDQRCSFSIK